jgi:membrane protease YdiL (CAAX protease family)
MEGGGWVTVVIAVAAIIGLALFLWFDWRRLPGATLRPRAFTPAAGFGLCALMLLGSIVGSEIVVALLDLPAPGPGQPAPEPTLRVSSLVGLGGYIGQAPIVIALLLLVARAPAGGGRRPGHAAAALAGLGALALVWPMSATAGWIGAWLQMLWGDASFDPIAHSTLKLLLAERGTPWWWVTIGLAVVAAPVFEEIFYRGLLQQTIRQGLRRPWISIAVTSGVFVVMHMGAIRELPAFASLFALSLGFGWIYEKTGRLTASIVMHAGFNAGNIIAAMTA